LPLVEELAAHLQTRATEEEAVVERAVGCERRDTGAERAAEVDVYARLHVEAEHVVGATEEEVIVVVARGPRGRWRRSVRLDVFRSRSWRQGRVICVRQRQEREAEDGDCGAENE